MPNDIYILHTTYTNSVTERRRKSVREYTYKTRISKEILVLPFSEATQLNVPRFIWNKKTKYSDLLRDGFRILCSNSIFRIYPVSALAPK